MARPEILYPYFCELTTLAGVGSKTRQRLSQLCGDSVIDVLFHLPRDLLQRTRSDDLRANVFTLLVKISRHHASPRRGMPHRIEARIQCLDPKHQFQDSILEIVYFHARGNYLLETFPEGEKRLISGRLDFRQNRWVMAHPDYVFAPEESEKIPALEPIYTLTQGLSNRLFRKAAHEALGKIPPLPEWHREKTLQHLDAPSFHQALYRAHHPETVNDLRTSPASSPAMKRLALDELLAQQLSLHLMRVRYRRKKGLTYKNVQGYRQKLEKSLGFTLSQTQQEAIGEIRADLHRSEPMLRLLMGEVGSGKTLVALMVMLDVLESGAKCALMVPSETLARQHQASIRTLLDAAGIDVPCPLLLGSTKTKEKKDIQEALLGEEPVLVIGTHALIQDKVHYHRLGMIVIDEQHRFGVEQRMAISRKADIPPEVLIMTATPIPRTLLMANYGDLDTTRLIGRNPHASEIKTVVIGHHRLQELTTRMRNILDKQQRLFWVCPLREESEKVDFAAAEQRFEDLQKLFPKQCFLLHGGLGAQQKAQTMQDFQAAPDGAILVSTTVIEVGIDIHDATAIIIEAAEYFGLAQLHQLRGRVGRGKLAGTCVLLHGEKLSKTAMERLEMMRSSNDGFALAEADLRLRGGGEIMGVKQSGLPDMRLADIEHMQELLLRAHDEAAYIVQLDPALSSPRGAALRTLLYLFRRDTALSFLQAG